MWHNTIVPFLVENPSMAIFLTLCLGYLVGKLMFLFVCLFSFACLFFVFVFSG